MLRSVRPSGQVIVPVGYGAHARRTQAAGGRGGRVPPTATPCPARCDPAFYALLGFTEAPSTAPWRLSGPGDSQTSKDSAERSRQLRVWGARGGSSHPAALRSLRRTPPPAHVPCTPAPVSSARAVHHAPYERAQLDGMGWDRRVCCERRRGEGGLARGYSTAIASRCVALRCGGAAVCRTSGSRGEDAARWSVRVESGARTSSEPSSNVVCTFLRPPFTSVVDWPPVRNIEVPRPTDRGEE